MIYKAVEVIWIFSAGRDGPGRAGIEGTIRVPGGPKNWQKCVKNRPKGSHHFM